MYGAIDLGTTFIKTHLGDIFPSGISTTIHNMSNNVMIIDNIQYAMEQLNEKSMYDTNTSKFLNSNLRLNYLYALHKISTESTNYKGIVVNCPASQWKNDDNIKKLKDILNTTEKITINVNGTIKDIAVNEIVVIPEDSAIYYTNEIDHEKFNRRRVLIVGLGSWNMNSILFENDEIIDMDTDEIGCLRIFKDIASHINTNYNSTS